MYLEKWNNLQIRTDGVYIVVDADLALETELNFYLVNRPNKMMMDNWIARVSFRQQAVYG